MVEHLPHYLKVEGLSPAVAGTVRENGKKKLGKSMVVEQWQKNLLKLKSIERKSRHLIRSGSTVVEHLPHYLKVEGLSLAIAETRRENG